MMQVKQAAEQLARIAAIYPTIRGLMASKPSETSKTSVGWLWAGRIAANECITIENLETVVDDIVDGRRLPNEPGEPGDRVYYRLVEACVALHDADQEALKTHVRRVETEQRKKTNANQPSQGERFAVYWKTIFAMDPEDPRKEEMREWCLNGGPKPNYTEELADVTRRRLRDIKNSRRV